MKPLFFLFVLTFSPIVLHATHMRAAYIYYHYIGDQTGVSHQYELHLVWHRNVDGISLPAQVQVTISSSCSANTIVALPRLSSFPNGNIDSSYYECISGNTPSHITDSYHFMDTITLPTVCHDWQFSLSCTACRNSTTNHAVNVSFYTETILNNLNGPNSSPTSDEIPVLLTCRSGVYQWPSYFVDNDGDSLYFYLSPAMTQPNSMVNYVSPYTATNPFGGAFTFSNDQFLINFSAVITGYFVISYTVEEYRPHPLGGFYQVGSSMRNFNILVKDIADCQNAPMPIPLNANAPNMAYNSNLSKYTLRQSAVDTSITLSLATPIHVNTLDATGTDFRLLDPEGNISPIISAQSKDAPLTQEIILTLASPLLNNGLYALVTKNGNDNNTLLTRCGLFVPQFDTVPIEVTNGQHITSPTHQGSRNGIHPNPASDWIIFETQTLGGQFKLFTALGEEVVSLRIDAFATRISITELAKATYFYSYTFNGEMISKGIIQKN